MERGAKERGLGDDLDFVRLLGNIQGLEKLVIEGYYAKNGQHSWNGEWLCEYKIYVEITCTEWILVVLDLGIECI